MKPITSLPASALLLCALWGTSALGLADAQAATITGRVAQTHCQTDKEVTIYTSDCKVYRYNTNGNNNCSGLSLGDRVQITGKPNGKFFEGTIDWHKPFQAFEGKVTMVSCNDAIFEVTRCGRTDAKTECTVGVNTQQCRALDLQNNEKVRVKGDFTWLSGCTIGNPTVTR